jgi:hypothetical protein
MATATKNCFIVEMEMKCHLAQLQFISRSEGKGKENAVEKSFSLRKWTGICKERGRGMECIERPKRDGQQLFDEFVR